MQDKATAYQKFIRQTARKLRLVADMVRNMPVDEAINQLTLLNKRAGRTVKKVLVAAKANAITTKKLDPKTLKVETIRIEEGPTYKRFRPVSRGRAHRILKRTAHIYIAISGSNQTKE